MAQMRLARCHVHNYFKAALINIFVLTVDQTPVHIVRCACSDEPAANYHPTIQCLWQLLIFLAQFWFDEQPLSLFWLTLKALINTQQTAVFADKSYKTSVPDPFKNKQGTDKVIVWLLVDDLAAKEPQEFKSEYWKINRGPFKLISELNFRAFGHR